MAVLFQNWYSTVASSFSFGCDNSFWFLCFSFSLFSHLYQLYCFSLIPGQHFFDPSMNGSPEVREVIPSTSRNSAEFASAVGGDIDVGKQSVATNNDVTSDVNSQSTDSSGSFSDRNVIVMPAVSSLDSNYRFAAANPQPQSFRPRLIDTVNKTAYAEAPRLPFANDAILLPTRNLMPQPARIDITKAFRLQSPSQIRKNFWLLICFKSM